MTLGRTGMAGARPAPRPVRDLLLAQGFGNDEIVSSQAPPRSRLAEPDLEPASFLPEFSPLVHRLQSQLGGGRALSVLVAGARDAGVARTYAALQIALGIGPSGRSVVLVDADFARPGLGGLLPDPTAEGLTDVVRFGRTVTALLLQPVPEGPWLLPAGSFPEEEALPLQGDELRSAIFRVAQRCDVAFYLAPMVVRDALHPLFSVCDLAIVVGEDDGAAEASALLEAARELRARQARLAGVVAFRRADTTSDLQTAPRFEPGFLYSPDLPLPEPATTLPREPVPQAPAPVPATPAPPSWPTPGASEPEWETSSAAGGDRSFYEPPDLVLPGEARLDDEPGEQTGQAAVLSRPAPGSLPEVPPPLPVFDTELREEPERERRDYESPVATRRSSEEARAAASAFGAEPGEFAFEEDGSPSRWPLFLVVAMLVMIVGFVSWALWNRHADSGPGSRVTVTVPPGSEPAPGSQESTKPTVTTREPAPAGEAEKPQGGAPGPATSQKPGAENPAGSSSASGELDDRAASAARRGTTTGPAPGGSGTQPGTLSRPASPEPTSPPVLASPGGTATTPQGAGTTPAEKPALPSTLPAAPAAGEVAHPGTGDFVYTVWVASYDKESQAQADLRSLRKRGYEGRAVPTDLGEKGIWFRVYAGSYATAAEAAAAREALLKLPEYKSFAMVRRLPRD
jgi:Mrp family chromosome partitioning ATPase